MMSYIKCELGRDSQDERDVCMPMHFDYVELPKEFTLKNKIKSIFNQLDVNSCSANAVSKQINIAGNLDYSPSRLFIYYNSRLLENEGNKRAISDNGVNLRSVMKSLMKYNFLDEKYYPYKIPAMVNLEPAEEYYKIANNNTSYISQYRKLIPNIYNMKYILSQLKLPIVCGIAIYDNFEKLESNNYTVPYPSYTNKLLGFHAVLLVSYDENKKCFEVLNSYGPYFGNCGFFSLTYDWVMNDDLCFDMWCIELKNENDQ